MSDLPRRSCRAIASVTPRHKPLITNNMLGQAQSLLICRTQTLAWLSPPMIGVSLLIILKRLLLTTHPSQGLSTTLPRSQQGINLITHLQIGGRPLHIWWYIHIVVLDFLKGLIVLIREWIKGILICPILSVMRSRTLRASRRGIEAKAETKADMTPLLWGQAQLPWGKHQHPQEDNLCCVDWGRSIWSTLTTLKMEPKVE